MSTCKGVYTTSLHRKCRACRWVSVLASVEKMAFIFPFVFLLVPAPALHPAERVSESPSRWLPRVETSFLKSRPAADGEQLRRSPVSTVVQRRISAHPTCLREVNASPPSVEANLDFLLSPWTSSLVPVIDFGGRAGLYAGDLEHPFPQSSERGPVVQRASW